VTVTDAQLRLARGIARRFARARANLYLADDLRREAELMLVRALRTYDPGRGVPADYWIARRVRGACLDLVRRERSRERRGRAAAPGRREAFVPVWDATEDYLGLLWPDERALVRLLLAGYTQREAARALGISKDTFARRLDAVRRGLGPALGAGPA